MQRDSRQRLDKELVSRSLADSRSRAQRLVRDGAVLLNGQTILDAARLVREEDRLEVTAAERYVSRGGLKLEAALEAFRVDASDKECLDLGASTGGFTDCLLQHGAAKVVAVDVGHGQLHPRLAGDGRVASFEGLHARDMEDAGIGGPFAIITVDVSFISLSKVIPFLAPFCREGSLLVALVKPQFEGGPGAVGKGGILKDEAKRRECLEGVLFELSKIGGWELRGTIDSPIEGGDGNKEYLLCAVRSEQ